MNEKMVCPECGNDERFQIQFAYYYELDCDNEGNIVEDLIIPDDVYSRSEYVMKMCPICGYQFDQYYL